MHDEADDTDTTTEAADTAAETSTSDDTRIPTRSVTGKPIVFVALTCGFLICMCCVVAVFGLGSLGFATMRGHDQARQDIGAPRNWSVDDSSAMPWVAEAELSGPADAAAVSDWLSELDADTDLATAEKCLTAAQPCLVEFTYGTYPVSVQYGARGEAAGATLTVG